jgi:hypothetical protein
MLLSPNHRVLVASEKTQLALKKRGSAGSRR